MATPPRNNRTQTSGVGTGMPVDNAGGPTIDPTANVLALVEAAVKRVDDILVLHIKRFDALRAADLAMVHRLIDSASAHSSEIQSLHVIYQKELAVAEANRINAIRSVDIAAVGVASERAVQQAGVLATQVSTSAEAFRALVKSTSDTMMQQLQQITQQFTERLSLLERAQYEAKGQKTVMDPQLERLNVMVEALAKSRDTGSGQRQGETDTRDNSRTLIGIAIAAGSFILAIAGVIITILTMKNHA